MKHWNKEEEARKEIKELITQYYHQFKEKKEPYHRETGFPMRQGCLMKRKCAPWRMPCWTSG